MNEDICNYDVISANIQKIASKEKGSLPEAILEEMGARRAFKLNGYPLVNVPFLCSSVGRISDFGPQETLPGLIMATYSTYVDIQDEQFTYAITQFGYERKELTEIAVNNLVRTAELSNNEFHFKINGNRILTPEIFVYEMGEIAHQMQTSGRISIPKSHSPIVLKKRHARSTRVY